MPVSMFSKKTTKVKLGHKGWAGYRSMCKDCNNSYNKEWVKDRKDDVNKKRREARYKNGQCSPKLSETERKEMVKLRRKKYKYNKKQAGKLTIKTIQLVYEDNIKRYGTLTCYLCLKPIKMQKEHLEHKTPLSRGGSNDYENLGISCSQCNIRKRNKTVDEYFEYLNNKKEEK